MPFVLAALLLAWAVMLLFGGMELDRGLLLILYAGDRPALADAARIVTEFGGGAIVLPAAATGAVLLMLRRDWRGAALILGITLSGRLLVELQKGWTHRLRPEDHQHLVAAQSYAFPSGHAANATLVWLTLALLLPRTAGARAAAMWGAVWLALAVGASRVVLGVHWPSDVIAGWALGLFWALLLLRLAGHPLHEGTPAPSASFSPRRRATMTDRTRPDDSAILDEAAAGPGQSGVSGGNLQREIGARAEEAHELGEAGDEGDAVTRVHGEDKPRDGDRPNLPNRN